VHIFSQITNIKVAHDNSRKAWRLPEVLTLDQIANYLEAIEVKPWSHEDIKQKELYAHVEAVQELDEDVQSSNVVARAIVRQTASAYTTSQISKECSVVVVTMIVNSSVNQLDSIAHRLVSGLWT